MKQIVRLSRKHTHLAGSTDEAIGVAFKRPLYNTGIISTIKEGRSIQAALTPQAEEALQMASCLYTF
jgi:hypothetical protein